ncbi:hypothetical protein CROQUDRAFT_655404 [Cronartium quercuum f. sp. fusiforme G11]|uniref:D-xylose 1-dehydrogenase (NADP(+), D-xylono-1,5-lactone-forming) n=1 Tax=Cronartium quercuum f. sp. fusiforme G11 TaxID=708437 RepID=A0A9P6NJ90_9BASI|nr:hypothetical protein CROQUDRAFT_655404 [Cronartium quercuum f. sp. fusiforme G11]
MASDPARKVLRWAVLGPGGISRAFVNDLLIDPATRDVVDVSHKLVAVGSRSIERAQNFINNFEQLKGQSVRAYGSYDTLAADADVDIIYVGSPHSSHYLHTKMCLIAGKHVLCEKPMTVNAQQARELFRLAKDKNLFLMEALWTRFFPLVESLQKDIASGVIGKIVQVHADFSLAFDPKLLAPTHRIYDPALAGGALLDLGPYSWTMLALTLLPQNNLNAQKDVSLNENCSAENPIESSLPIPKIKASGVLFRHPKAQPDSSKVDASIIAVLEFPTPSGEITQGILESSIMRETIKDRAVTIYGSSGQIRIAFPTCCPHDYYITTDTLASSGDVRRVTTNPSKATEERRSFSIPGDGLGYMWEADEAARCIFARNIESSRMSHRDTILMMEVFDEIRKQIGLEYPAEIEKL